MVTLARSNPTNRVTPHKGKGADMNRLPVDDAARARLRDAQKAEVIALRRIQTAETARARVRAALDAAERTLATAKVELVTTSGTDRAALLLNEPAGSLRRLAREAGKKSIGPA